MGDENERNKNVKKDERNEKERRKQDNVMEMKEIKKRRRK